MLKDTAFGTLNTLDILTTLIDRLPTSLLSTTYAFHDVRVTCYTNTPVIQALLDSLLAHFPIPQRTRGEVTYVVLCYESAAQFPLLLPRQRVRVDTMRLLTHTKLKYYRSSDATRQYQRYEALP